MPVMLSIAIGSKKMFSYLLKLRIFFATKNPARNIIRLNNTKDIARIVK